MAKERRRGNREAKKPKAPRKPAPAAASPFTQVPPGRRPVPTKGDGK